MREQINARLQELREDFRKGQAHLAELEMQAASLRETLLRISGAIQVIEELLASRAPEAGDAPFRSEGPQN